MNVVRIFFAQKLFFTMIFFVFLFKLRCFAISKAEKQQLFFKSLFMLTYFLVLFLIFSEFYQDGSKTWLLFQVKQIIVYIYICMRSGMKSEWSYCCVYIFHSFFLLFLVSIFNRLPCFNLYKAIRIEKKTENVRVRR